MNISYLTDKSYFKICSRKKLSAEAEKRSIFRFLSALYWNLLEQVPAGPETPTQTVPAGSRSSPYASAQPVVATEKVLPVSFLTPSAIASATALLTMPLFSIVSAGTPNTFCFTSGAYEVTDPRKYPEDPGTVVIRWAISPPVQDSAALRVRPVPRSRRPMVPSRVSSESEYR